MTNALGILVGGVALVGAIYLLWRPRWSVMLVLLMFPLEQILQAYLPFLVAHHALFNIILGALVAVAATVRFFKGDRPATALVNRVSLGIFVLVALSWIGIIWSPSRQIAWKFVNDDLPYVILTLVFTPLLLDDLEDFGRLAIGFMLVGSCIAILILVHPNSNYYAGRLGFDIGDWEGQSGGRSNPLALANMGGFMAIIAVLVKFDRRIRGITLLRIAAFMLGIGIAIATGSRGQVLGAAAASVLFFPLSRKMQDPKQFLAMAFGIGTLGLLLYVTFNLFIGKENTERWDIIGAAKASGGRLDMALALLKVYVTSPLNWLQGLGSNAFTTVSPFRRTPYVHNVYIEVLCELGLIGAVILGVVTTGTIKNGRWLWKTFADDPSRRSLAALLGALCVFDGFLMMKQGSWVAGGASAMMSWLVLAKIAGLEQRRMESPALATEPDEEEEHDLDTAPSWEDEALADAYENGEWSEALLGESDGEYATA